jgi:2-keto-4-pentenoate hydratase/2-oxohepta-3-ene-1,7-dioic acid hydratase in catechol pathway
MIYARFRHATRESYGVIEGAHIFELEGDIFGEHSPAQTGVPLSEAVLLAPVPRPGKILAAAVNYQSHAPGASVITKSDEPPAEPQLFLKPSSSVVGPDDQIVLPEGARRVDAEGELVAVIGRVCRVVSAEDALDYVLGYTCGNDVSARHWQRDDLQWWRAKGADTFSPIGPVIATDLEPAALDLSTRVNGAERQQTNTSALVHSVAELIAFASRTCTLEPGDLIFTGTPGETPTMNGGDIVEVEIGGIGVLRNPVLRPEPDSPAGQRD